MASNCSVAVGSGAPASHAAWSWASTSAVDRWAGSPQPACTQRGAAGVPALVKPVVRRPVQVHSAALGLGLSTTSLSLSAMVRSQQAAQNGAGAWPPT
jgi:hypothetical protein